MLRMLLLLLALLNGLYYAWAHQLLRPYGYGPAQQAEPHRVAQQIEPQLVQVLTADEARRGEPAASAPRGVECLQSPLLDEAQAQALRQAFQGAALPAGSWQIDALAQAGRWIVYMGKFPDPQALARKRAELVALNVRLEPLRNAALEPGLSLGGFDSEERARAEMAALAQRGVRTAAVVQELVEQRGHLLRLPVVDDGLRARLEELRPALAATPLQACR